jgi:hypothetical protein
MVIIIITRQPHHNSARTTTETRVFASADSAISYIDDCYEMAEDDSIVEVDYCLV